MKNRKISLATLLLLGIQPLCAMSAEITPSAGNPEAESIPPAIHEQPAPIFDALDTNHDGYVTKEEAKRSADVMARFKRLDSDRDGRISPREFTHGKI